MPFPSSAHRAQLLAALRLLNVNQVAVHFSGGGDSGEIEGCSAINAAGASVTEELKTQCMNWPKTESHFDHDSSSWVKQTIETSMTLEKILISVTEDALEDSQLDWYNDAGGQGTFSIDFSTTPPTIDLDVEINYTSTEDHHFDYSDAEED